MFQFVAAQKITVNLESNKTISFFIAIITISVYIPQNLKFILAIFVSIYYKFVIKVSLNDKTQ